MTTPFGTRNSEGLCHQWRRSFQFGCSEIEVLDDSNNGLRLAIAVVLES